MSIFEQKEKNLIKLIDKLNNLTSTYSQSSYEAEKIKTEKNELLRQKSDIEKKNHELMREHKYLKEKVASLQEEVNKNSIVEEKFNQDIEELSQETENLVSEIDKWQT
jgi:chromosome segregation ATPase|tara:strand:- start:249 stop:572 length:324 start_codon:yes stop_codon:yes gene_type:complete